jgi:hypothetical protein
VLIRVRGNLRRLLRLLAVRGKGDQHRCSNHEQFLFPCPASHFHPWNGRHSAGKEPCLLQHNTFIVDEPIFNTADPQPQPPYRTEFDRPLPRRTGTTAEEPRPLTWEPRPVRPSSVQKPRENLPRFGRECAVRIARFCLRLFMVPSTIALEQTAAANAPGRRGLLVLFMHATLF